VSLHMVHGTESENQLRDDGDHELLARVAGGEVEAFERLYRRYYKRVFGFAARLTPRLEIAEEVVDDTMLTVWRKAGNFAGRSKPSTWIFGIAYRKALKASRRFPDDKMAGNVSETELRQTDGLESIVVRQQIAQALGRLPREQRAVVELTYLRGYTYTEIADIAGCPVGTVKTRMRSAREKLRVLLTTREEQMKEADNAHA